jgi:hypothetical protein
MARATNRRSLFARFSRTRYRFPRESGQKIEADKISSLVRERDLEPAGNVQKELYIDGDNDSPHPALRPPRYLTHPCPGLEKTFNLQYLSRPFVYS